MYENLNFSSQEKVIKVLTKAIEIYNVKKKIFMF